MCDPEILPLLILLIIYMYLVRNDELKMSNQSINQWLFNDVYWSPNYDFE